MRPSLVSRAAAVGILLTLTACGSGSAPHPAPPTATSTASIGTVVVETAGHPLGTVGPDFQGLSFETGSLPSGAFAAAGNLPRLLENLGPGVMRFGGNSVDKAHVTVSADQLSALAGLAGATGWKVVYAENEGQFNAAQVTADSTAVARALGSSLLGLACGNEPEGWVKAGYRPATWGPAAELADASTCLAAVRAGAPQVPFIGNDAGDGARWVSQYAPWAKGKAALLTTHYYPLTNCKDASRSAGSVASSVASLVSASTAATEAQRLASVAAPADQAGLPIRMDETNSASCGGLPGVSDSDASALWAADYLMLLAEHGFTGANFHGRLDGSTCTGYTPLCPSGAGDHDFRAQPVYYGLLFAHLLGTGHVLPVKAPADGQLAAHAVKGADGTVRTMLINRSSQPVTVTVRPDSGSWQAATGWRLSLPSLTATSGVTIGGASVAADGSFTPGAGEQLPCANGGCTVTLPADSGLVLSGS